MNANPDHSTEIQELRKRVAYLERQLGRADRQVMALCEALGQVGSGAQALGEVALKLREDAIR